MKSIGKGTSILVLAIIVSIISVLSSYTAYSYMEESVRVSHEISNTLNVEVSDVSTIALNDEGITVLNEPSIVNGVISYSLLLEYLDSYSQFQFAITNRGDVDVRVASINIEGLNENSEYATVELTNLKVGDVIEAGVLLSDVKVVTRYSKQYFDANFIPQSIKLDKIKINIEFEIVE